MANEKVLVLKTLDNFDVGLSLKRVAPSQEEK